MGRTAKSPTTTRSRRSGGRRSTQGRPARQSLQRRILSRVLAISIVPLLVIGTVALVSLVGLSRSAERDLASSRDDLARDVVGRAVRTDAVDVMRDVDQLIGERVDDVVGLSAAPSVRNAARQAGDDGDVLVLQPTSDLEDQFSDSRRLAPGSGADRYLRSFTDREPLFSELFFTERNGLAVAASSRTSDFVQSDETWWNRAWDDGLYLGPIELDESSDAVGLTVAARIDGSAGGEPLGVVKGVIVLDRLQAIADRVARDTGSEITIVADDGRLLAETSSDHNPSRIMNPDLELDAEREAMVNEATDATEPDFALTDEAVVGYAQLSAIDGRLSGLLEQFERVDPGPVQWVTVVEQPNDTAFAPLVGLSNVRVGLSETARIFAVITVVALLAALVAAVLVSTRLAQRIVGPLRSLGAKARMIADHQLPLLVRSAQTPGEPDDDLPVLSAVELHTNDEIEDVADAFNIVSSTAADLASDQARSRRDVSRMFVSLGRRNQNLLSRQLELIDRLERETSDPDLLDDLFRLDHLATRMRRNAESLLVLAGEQPARRWSEPVSVTDVVRGAISEIEDYRRVSLDSLDEALLAGTVVADVTHLLAELIENAAQFSPPDTDVVIVGRRVVDGYSLAIVDDGVGMGEEQLEDANRRISASPLVDRVPSSFLGLFVVGRLAARHGIRVKLVESTTEGVTAKVLVPSTLIDPAVPSALHGGRDARALPALAAGPDADESSQPDDAAAAWVDVTDDATAARSGRERVSASAVRDRSGLEQTIPPIPGRRGQSWSVEGRVDTGAADGRPSGSTDDGSSHGSEDGGSFEPDEDRPPYGSASFDHIEVRGLDDDDADLGEPPDVIGAWGEPRDAATTPQARVGDDRDVDDLRSVWRDDDVDFGVDLHEREARERPEPADDTAAPDEGPDRFDDDGYAGSVRYPSVEDAAAPRDIARPTGEPSRPIGDPAPGSWEADHSPWDAVLTPGDDVETVGTDTEQRADTSSAAPSRVEPSSLDEPASVGAVWSVPAHATPDRDLSDQDVQDRGLPDQDAQDWDLPDQDAQDWDLPDQDAQDWDLSDQDAQDWDLPDQDVQDRDLPAHLPDDTTRERTVLRPADDADDLEDDGVGVARHGDDGARRDDEDLSRRDHVDVAGPDEEPSDAAPMLEVRRRPSRRNGGGSAAGDGWPQPGRAVLRTEQRGLPAAQSSQPGARSSRQEPSPFVARADTTDEHGVTLTDAEREARAARERLSRFQRAVQQGRSQTRSRHNGGEHRDA
jgi:signal transduction histidine kinase